MDSSTNIIPIIDVSPFIDDRYKSKRDEVKKSIFDACINYGVFQIENHGIPIDLCNKLMKLSKTFFTFTEEHKNNITFPDHYISGTGYHRRSIDALHDFEYLLMHSPEKSFNGIPLIPDEYRKTFEEAYKYFSKTAQILEEIISACMKLSGYSLSDHNNDRSEDYMLAMHYHPLITQTQTGNEGIMKHEDPNMFTIVLQDKVFGLEVLKDDEWVKVVPMKGKLVVLIGDLLQVFTNKMFKSVSRRTWKQKGKNRYVINFSYTLHGDKWVEPFPEFTRVAKKASKYKGFMCKDYIDLKKKDNKNPPTNLEDLINITYYEI